MRLGQLNASYCALVGEGAARNFVTGDKARELQQGVYFLCPKCLPTEKSHRVEIWFFNPRKGEATGRGPLPLHQRTGDSLGVLSVPDLRFNCGWRGSIVNGAVIQTT